VTMIDFNGGITFDYDNPSLSGVGIQFIANSLSKQCRWGGNINRFYSVAEHSVRASWVVPRKFKLTALMHDAAEAFISDVPTPLKRTLPRLMEIEESILQLLAEKYGFIYPLPPEILYIDKVMLATERRDLLTNMPLWDVIKDIAPLTEVISMVEKPCSEWASLFVSEFMELA